MKKKIISILLAVCMVLSVMSVAAVTVTAAPGEYFTYTYKSQTLKYTVLSEYGSVGTVCPEYTDKQMSGALEIPSSVENGGKTYLVTAIYDNAFLDCSGITSVIIPETVTKIGSNAFNKVSFANVTFSGDLPSISDNSFDGTSLTVDDKTATSGVSVEIVGFKNGKTISQEPFWLGELLMPRVSGYSGSDTLYYRFETDNTMANEFLTFYTSDTDKQESGVYNGYCRNEAYAAICMHGVAATKIKCSVYTMKKDGGKFTATKIAEVQNDLTSDNFITDYNTAFEKEYSTQMVFVMQQGETITIKDLVAKSGFVHVDCDACCFSEIETSKYNDQDLTVNEFSFGTKDTEIIASTTKTGLSKITYNAYINFCTYHGSAYTQFMPLAVTMYIDVVPAPTITTSCSSIKVTDNTPAPDTSTYQIGLGPVGTEFTNLQSTAEYAVMQTVNTTVNSQARTGFYYHYKLTEKGYNITNLTPESAKTTNNGYVTVAAKAGEGDIVQITPVPNEGYVVDKVYYNDGTQHEITASGSNYSFTMPAKDVSVSATFVDPIPPCVKNAKYSVSLTLNEGVDMNFIMTDYASDFDIKKLTVAVDDIAAKVDYSTVGTVVGLLKSMSPAQMSEQLHIVVTYDSVVVKDTTYSVRKYCETVFAHKDYGVGSDLGQLCKSILNYGKWAEDYYNEQHKTGKAPSTLNKDYEIDLSTIAVQAKPKAINNKTENITDAGANLDISGRTKLVYSFVTDMDLSFDSKSETGQNLFVINDKETPEQINPKYITLNKKTADPSKGTYEYTVSIEMIATQLGTSYTLKIKDIDTDTFCITYGVYNYCADVQSKTGESFTDNLKAMCKTLYVYGVATKTWID